MEALSNVANKYGARIAGYICPPATGNYTFWIASADNGELWLSTDNLPANKQKIAFHTGSTNSRQWNKYATQKSAVIYLVQGQSYYVEALMKESSGSDNLAVGWLKPGQTGSSPSQVIPGSVLSPMDGFVFKTLSAEDVAAEMNDSINSIDLVPDNVTIYPNPVTNRTLNVQLEGGIREDFNLSVYDMTGRSLIEKHFEQQSKVAIDVSAFQMGVYMLVVRNNNLKFSKKFIVN
jgi:xyloglucan-specific exo-beta-1,4-glucanase